MWACLRQCGLACASHAAHLNSSLTHLRTSSLARATRRVRKKSERFGCPRLTCNLCTSCCRVGSSSAPGRPPEASDTGVPRTERRGGGLVSGSS
eukprot:8366582-Pyramimonas_sp.AAC.1